WLLKNPSLRTTLPALPFASLRQQQRNEIMQNFLRFVNWVSIFFCLGSSRQTPRFAPPNRPATLASPALQRRVVLRGGEYYGSKLPLASALAK
ncbi:hypothetical protein, partial [Cupriavidus numazuensis]